MSRLAVVVTAVAALAAAPAALPASIANGQSIYATWCAQCHNANPRNDAFVPLAADNAQRIALAIAGRVPNMAVLRTVLTPADLDDVAAYLGTVFAPASPPTVTVVEYYWAARDHYFITAGAAEIAALDAAPPGGWVRTGKTFRALAAPQAANSPVCRFYLPLEFGDSHYYGRGTVECDATHAAFPGFVYESPAVMYLYLPTNGVCPAGTIPVYRVFSARADANHRYTTERAVRDQMVAQGWVAEGDGPDLVVMCAPGP